MKFIIPQNYEFNTKILGIMDYQSALLDVIWCGVILFIIKGICIKIEIKIFIFMILALPVIIFSIVGLNGENIIYVLKYMAKYIIIPKVLLYERENNDCKKS